MLKNLYNKLGARSLVAKNHDKALRWFRRAGNDLGQGEAHLQLKQYTQAREAFERAGESVRAAQAAMEGGDFDSARRLYLSVDDVHSAAHALLKGGKQKDAVQLFLDRDQVEEAANFCESTGHRSQAAGLYAKAKKYDTAIAIYHELGQVEQMLSVCKKKGNLEQTAREFEDKGELILAAMLYELNKQPDRAAELYLREKDYEKAIALYNEARKYIQVGEIYEEMGRLNLAADAYSLLDEGQIKAAELYHRLIVLNEAEQRDFKAKIIAYAFSGDKKVIVMGTARREVLYLTSTFSHKWKYKIGGDGTPAALALSQDGKKIAIGSKGPLDSGNHALILLNETKEEIWRTGLFAPAEDIIFMPGDEALAVAIGDKLVCYNMEGKPIWEKAVDFKAWTLDVIYVPPRLVVGTLGGAIMMFDDQGNDIALTELDARVHCLDFSSDGSFLTAAVGDNRLARINSALEIIWETELPHNVRSQACLEKYDVTVAAGLREVTLLDGHGKNIMQMNLPDPVSLCFVHPDNQLVYIALDPGQLISYLPTDCEQASADCYRRAGMLFEAAEIYRNIEAYDLAYSLYREIGDFESAAQTLQLTGDVLTAARHFEAAGQYEKAAELYEQANDPIQAANCYGKAGNSLKAAEMFEQLDDFILAASHYERGGNYKKAGQIFNRIDQTDQAIENFRLTLKENPNDNDIMFELAELLHADEEYDEAIRLYQRLHGNEEYGRQALKGLGQCFMEKDLIEVAIDRFYECIGPSQKPTRDNIDVYFLIGKAHEREGDYDKAKEAFAKVLAIDYYYKDIQERLRQSTELSKLVTLNEADTPVNFGEQATGDVSGEVVKEKEQRYKIISKIGEGGMGVVYLATDVKLNRQVAWKVLPAHLARSEEHQQRMIREAQTVAQLNNNHIVAIYDIITDEDEFSITMEYVDGGTLRRMLHNKRKLSVSRALKYFSQMADGLQTAHNAGVVHRDIKPENILITQKTDQIKMVDFGLARLSDDSHLTREGIVVGTMAYMAPEQIRAEEADCRADIYACGVVMYEMLLGERPFRGDNILAQHLHKVAPMLHELTSEIPQPVSELIAACMAKKLEERPENCGEIIQTIQSFAIN